MIVGSGASGVHPAVAHLAAGEEVAEYDLPHRTGSNAPNHRSRPHRRRRGPVIGVDVATDPALTSLAHGVGEVSLWQLLRRGRKMPPIVDILARAGTVSSDSRTKKSHGQANLMFAPTMGSIDLLDWRAYERAIAAGYRHATAKLECLDKSVLQRLWAPVRPSGNDFPHQLRQYEQRSKGPLSHRRAAAQQAA